MRITQILLLLAFLPGVGFSQSDQELIYTSFLGGNQFEFASAVGYNNENPDEFILGATTESQNLQTVGSSYLPFFNGGLNDAYYARFSSDGNITYSTFFGGSDLENIYDLIITNDGQLVICGSTRSSDFPLEDADNDEFNGTSSGWLAKFDEEDELLWSTYVGGDGDNENVRAVNNDETGNIYICGSTNSTNLATEGVFQEEIINPEVASGMVGKYSPDGELIWLTYFADEEMVILESVAVSLDGQTVYALGWSSRTDPFEVTSFQSDNAGSADVLLLAFSSLDGTLNWGTYFGGESFETASDLVIDETGKIVIAGNTGSDEGIATTEAFQGDILGVSDFFIAAFTAEGELEWSTYVGGSSSETGPVHLDASNSTLFFGGSVDSDDMPIVGSPYFSSVEQSQINIGVGYMAKFDLEGNAIWSTYTNEAYTCGSCSRIAVSLDDKIFCVGSYLFPASSDECEESISPDAFQTEYGGGNADIGIFIFQENTLSTSFPKAEPLTIYPNPTQDFVTIEAPNLLWAGMELTVTDISGRQVDRVARFQSGNAYSTSHLSDGVYILTGQIGERMFRQKLVVQR